jgi:hypothetical protein
MLMESSQRLAASPDDTAPAPGTVLPPNDVCQALERRLRSDTRGQTLFDAASRGRYATDASIYQIMPVGVTNSLSLSLGAVSAVAAGLVAGMGLKLTATLARHPLGRWCSAALALASFIAMAVMRVPLAWVLLVVGGAGCVLTWRKLAP